MGLFYNKGQYQGYNIYSMKKYVDKKKNYIKLCSCYNISNYIDADYLLYCRYFNSSKKIKKI